MAVNQDEPDINIALTMSTVSANTPSPQVDSFFKSQTKYAEKVSEQAVTDLDASRRRGDIWGKAVLSIGTTLVTGLGIGTLVNVFPVEDGGGIAAVVIAVVLFALAVGGVIIVGLAVSKINEPIVMRLDMDTNTEGMDAKDQTIVKEVYGRFAKVNGRPTLEQYARYGMAVERIKTELDSLPPNTPIDDLTAAYIVWEFWKPTSVAKWNAAEAELCRIVAELTQSATTTRALERAAMIRAEVKATMASASVALARHRVVAAITGLGTIFGLLIIPLGLVGALIAADFANSNGSRRSTEIAENKSCVELVEAAQKQGVTVVENCAKVVLPTKPPNSDPTPVSDYDRLARVAKWNAVLDQYSTCFRDSKVVDKVAVCDPILDRGVG